VLELAFLDGGDQLRCYRFNVAPEAHSPSLTVPPAP